MEFDNDITMNSRNAQLLTQEAWLSKFSEYIDVEQGVLTDQATNRYFQFVLVMEKSMPNISISHLLNETVNQIGVNYSTTLDNHCYEIVIEKTGMTWPIYLYMLVIQSCQAAIKNSNKISTLTKL